MPGADDAVEKNNMSKRNECRGGVFNTGDQERPQK